MSQQSPASLKTKASSSPIRSFLTGSAFSLFFTGFLTGCQTTTGISSTSVSTPESQTTTVITNDDFNSLNSQTDSDATQAQDDYPVYDPDSLPNQDQAISIDQAKTGDQAETGEPNRAESPVTPTHREPVIRPQPELTDQRSVQQILIDQARQNSNHTAQHKPTIEDGSNIPAFKKLMDTGVQQLRQGQIAAADDTFTRAQRLAPQSSAVYFYLGQVALKQNQPLKAEAMARRGLVVAKSDSRKKALWQVILKAAQTQGNSKVIKEARATLSQ